MVPGICLFMLLWPSSFIIVTIVTSTEPTAWARLCLLQIISWKHMRKYLENNFLFKSTVICSFPFPTVGIIPVLDICIIECWSHLQIFSQSFKLLQCQCMSWCWAEANKIFLWKLLMWVILFRSVSRDIITPRHNSQWESRPILCNFSQQMWGTAKVCNSNQWTIIVWYQNQVS